MKLNLHTCLILGAIALALVNGFFGVVALWIPVVLLGTSVLIMIRGMS